MKNSTFRPGNHPHVAKNLMALSWPNKDGTIKNIPSIYPLNPAIDLGGAGLYTSAPDFMALLTSLLRNDGKILRPETLDTMFEWRVPDETIFKSEKVKGWFEDFVEEGMELDHCLCDVVNM
jgi:hypothetical protein